MTLSEVFSPDAKVYNAYVFWSAVLVIKLLAMSILTAIQRIKNKTFANVEDLPSKKLKVKFDDPDVERVRRAHRNDLENILPFFVIAFFYIGLNPSAFLATNLIRVFAISRIIHTLVYAVVVIPQPARALSWFVSYAIVGYMAVQVLLAAL